SSLFAQNPASIQLYIAGSPYFGAITAPSTTNTWIEYNNTWQSGLNQSVEVCLYDANTNVDGNDFGLDDISIIKCECDLGVSAGPDKSICLGDSVQLEGSGAVAYFWSPTNTLSCFTCSNPVASPDVTTSYTVTVSGPGGCTALDSALVTVFQHFDLNAGPDTTICENTPVQLHAEGAVSYTWVPSAGLTDPDISNPVATPSQSTTYYLSATDEHGCLQSDSTTIKIFPGFHDSVLITPHDTTICPGGFAEFHVTGAGNYKWQPQDHLSCDTCGTVIATPSASTTYTVTIADSNGCSTSSDTARVNIDLGCSHLVIPSAFSPNNDGRNDFFHVLSQGVISLSLTLYNRWGELIFSTSDPDSTWDGRVNGKEQPAGVYIWVLKASLDDGTVINRNGNVTLVR
ncbi:MAG: gliding motility-associated C-terminal domain-containing protein, partial [Chitinophagales bacterium]